MKLFKLFNGQFAGADKDSIEELSKMKVGEVIDVSPIKMGIKQQRSSKQNRYYWGVVIETIFQSLDNGINRDQIHTVLKMGFFGAESYLGVVFPKGNTKDLSTVKMEEFLTLARGWASTRNIYIPLPRECGYDY